MSKVSSNRTILIPSGRNAGKEFSQFQLIKARAGQGKITEVATIGKNLIVMSVKKYKELKNG